MPRPPQRLQCAFAEVDLALAELGNAQLPGVVGAVAVSFRYRNGAM
jgi:hypothetical protein